MKTIGQDAFYDVTADGQRFLINDFISAADVQPLTLVAGWAEK